MICPGERERPQIFYRDRGLYAVDKYRRARANASYALRYRFPDKPWHPFDYRKFVTKRLQIAVTFKRRMRRVVRTTGALRKQI